MESARKKAKVFPSGEIEAAEALRWTSSWEPPVVLMEMTLKNLMGGRTVDHADFLARADILRTLGKTVMISNYTRFDRVTAYLPQLHS